MKRHPLPVRVRYAPSPTGFQQLGNFRTVLYNYLFAKRHGGIFILRIEDTDQKRFVTGALENTLVILKKFGLAYDEGPLLLQEKQAEEDGKLSVNYPGIYEKGAFGPYIQSERLETYRHYALELIEKGAAYYCFCTEERLTRLREEQTKEKRPTGYDGHCRALDEELIKNNLEKRTPFVIRFKIPEGRGTITFTDEIRGKVAIEASALDDHVLLKSDGYPTYHLASVVDDHLMEISHVVRGEDWLPSTPKHILLYEAFGWTIPLYAHLPLILNEDKTKLSKRKGDKSIDGFLERGYLKEAILNFVALLGWNPGKGSTEEFFTLDELTQVFDFSQVNKSGAVFDSKKLDWMNHHYIMKKTPQELLSLLQEGKFLEEKGYYQEAPADRKLDAFLLKVIAVEQERLTTLFEVGENTPFFFKETLSYPVALLAWKENSQEQTKEALAKAIEILEKVGEGEWARENLAKTLLEMAGDKKGDFLWPLRVALTGAECSPSPMDVAWVLGKATSLKRIQRALSLFEAL